jgi:hypothetical protein
MPEPTIVTTLPLNFNRGVKLICTGKKRKFGCLLLHPALVCCNKAAAKVAAAQLNRWVEKLSRRQY